MCPATTHVEKVAAETFSVQLKHTFQTGHTQFNSVHDGEGQQYYRTFRTTSRVLKHITINTFSPQLVVFLAGTILTATTLVATYCGWNYKERLQLGKVW